jgi:hypothetical protein
LRQIGIRITAKASTECAPLAACVEFMTESFPVTDVLGREFPCGKDA